MKRKTNCSEDLRHTAPLSTRTKTMVRWKFEVLKCGPDKSCRQGPHPFSIQTRRKVAYPLGTSILSPVSFNHPAKPTPPRPPLSGFLLPSFLSYVKAQPRVSAPTAAEVPPLAITMKDGHRIWPRSFLTNTRLRYVAGTRNYGRQATNIFAAMRGPTLFFFFIFFSTKTTFIYFFHRSILRLFNRDSMSGEYFQKLSSSI